MKWSGKIGFAQSVETAPGVWNDQIIERNYKGDLIKTFRRTQSPNKVNDDISMLNQISIIADPYLNKNLYSIKYVTFMGTSWKIETVDVEYPRLLLSLGGVYVD